MTLDWQSHKETIIDLYHTYKLEEVRNRMKLQYRFDARYDLCCIPGCDPTLEG